VPRKQPIVARDVDEPRQVIEHELTDDLQQHRGRWVAIFGAQVIAVADSAGDVFEIAVRKGVTDPTILRVPEHPDRLAFYRRA
jgi:hypothetical protein